MGEPKIDLQESDPGGSKVDPSAPANLHSVAAIPKPPSLLRKFLLPLIVLGLGFWFFEPVKNTITNFLECESTDDATIVGQSIMISNKVGGVVEKVHFQDHSRVKKGDLLVELDPREFLNSIKQLEAELNAATAVYELAKQELDRGDFDNIVERRKNEVDSEGALVDEAKRDFVRGEFDTIVNRRKSELNSGMVLLEEAKKTLKRMGELKKQNLISEVEFDAATTNYENNLAKVNALKGQLKEAELAAQRSQEAAEAKFRSLMSKHRASQAQLREASAVAKTAHDRAVSNYRSALARIWSIRAQLDQAQLNLEFTKIRAPADGVLSRRSVEPGMILKPNHPISLMLSSGEKWVVANFKETQLKNIYIGQPVEIEIDAIAGKVFEGTVQSISPGSGSVFALIPADNATGNFTKIVQRVPVKIAFKPESAKGLESMAIAGISVVVRAKIGPHPK